MTVRGQCTDVNVSTECWDDHAAALGNNGGARATHLATSCTCAVEQHYQYRWDELNRIHEARRYDRSGGIGNWELQVRQRYRYDAGNVRVIKETTTTSRAPRRAAASTASSTRRSTCTRATSSAAGWKRTGWLTPGTRERARRRST